MSADVALPTPGNQELQQQAVSLLRPIEQATRKGSGWHFPDHAAVELLDEVCAAIVDPPSPPGLIGQPCEETAALWHWHRLRATIGSSEPAFAVAATRAAYHARSLLRLMEPQQPAWRALVSVLIPVFDRSELVGNAIDSALGQTHRAVEIIVVDDGSTDGLGKALSAYGNRIRLVHQHHQGVSRARNHGLALAQGDFVHFLDSDDLLDPEAMERWLAALACIPDADLCYSPPRQRNVQEKLDPSSSTHCIPRYLHPLNGGRESPTADLGLAACSGDLFVPVGVLTARWRLLEAGGFSEGLSRSEDYALWVRLGLKGAKVIGLRERSSERRKLPTGLSSTARPGENAKALLLGLLDRVGPGGPTDQALALIRQLRHPSCWHYLESSEEPVVVVGRRTLLARLGGLASVNRPLLRALHALGASRREQGSPNQPANAYSVALESMARASLTTSLPLEGDDLITILSLMAQNHWWPCPAAGDEGLLHALETVSQSPTPAVPIPGTIVGRPCSQPARSFHARALTELLSATEPGECPALERIAYHASWLAALLATPEAKPGPLVSVVIPLFNRAEVIGEAVASCLAQTYQPLEVLVVDDGSFDDPETALAPWFEHIRYVRQGINCGAGSARNLGIRHARGTLIHFLDADDLLDSTAIARKVEALRAIPDAELVFSGAEQNGRGLHESNLEFLEPPPRSIDCPSRDLFRRRVSPEDYPGYPFLTSTVLACRWTLLAVDGFEPGLRRGQDTELFYRLSLRGTKAVGITGRLTLRRVGPRSLSATLPSSSELVHMRGLCLLNLFGAPQHWVLHREPAVRAVLRTPLFVALALDPSIALQNLRQALLCRITELGQQTRSVSGGQERQTAREFLELLQREVLLLSTESPALASIPFHRELCDGIAKALASLPESHGKKEPVAMGTASAGSVGAGSIDSL